MLGLILQILGFVQCLYGSFFAIKLIGDDEVDPYARTSYVMNVIYGLLLINVGIWI